ncbi:hypothetical protein HZA96_03260 [Candidatus Woesearchaeota archaeon]|nr:hypothetical protein [Candidatus Woesearchaeota archaeon]
MSSKLIYKLTKEPDQIINSLEYYSDQIINSLEYYSSDDRHSKDKPESFPAVMRRSPDYSQHRYKIDDLVSFAVLGLDVKITPDSEVKIIEVNGINSGMKGFQEAGVEYKGTPSDEELMRRIFSHFDSFKFDNDNLLEYIKTDLRSKNSCDEALTSHINGLGKEPIAYIAARLAVEGYFQNRMKGTKDVFTLDKRSLEDRLNPYLSGIINKDTLFTENRVLRNVHPDWESRYGNFAETLIGIERILKDKLQSDTFFDGCRGIKPKTHEYTEENFHRLVQAEQPKYVVIKPYNGSRGEGLVIVPATTLAEERPDPNERKYVVESFVSSKPILSEKDGQFHDGCMRYVVFVEENKRGRITLHDFGGYWRLCPRPISEDLDIDGMRANLAQGALAEKVSAEDMKIVREAIGRNVPMFYRNLVQRADPQREMKSLLREYSRL